jgi:uncharacterized protein involved in exopolysaccharide biosynthesis
MSRIDEALKRLTGAHRESRNPSTLERFAAESAPTREERAVTSFVGSGPLGSGPLRVERRPSSPPQITERRPAVTVPAQAAAAPAAPQKLVDQTIEVEPTPEDERLVDVRQFIDYSHFVFGAVRRHAVLVAAVFGIVVALTGTGLLVMPKTYHVQVKLLAQRNEVMTALSNPGRAVPWDADSPTRAAAETVLRRDNLISIIGMTNLLEDWSRTRAPILRLKDGLKKLLLGRALTPDERLDQLVNYLEAEMKVVAAPGGDGTVTIDLDWPNAQMAFRLVEAAQQTFLEARQRAEAAAIGESIGILERYSATLHENISHTLTEIQKAQPTQRKAPTLTPRAALRSAAVAALGPRNAAPLLPPVPAAAVDAMASASGLDDPEIPKIKAQLTAKRQQLSTIEESRQRQLSELQTKLTQLTTIYTPTHPNVQAVQQNISALSHEPPQVAPLKAEIDRLAADYQTRVEAVAELERDAQQRTDAAKRTAADEAAAVSHEKEPAPAAAPEPPGIPPAAASTMNDFSAVQLRLELNQLESVLERTDGARIELAVSQAAFKYRYTVIKPAQVPRYPVKPNATLVIAAGFIAGLMFAIAAAVGKDLMSNRILEQWQIERQLGLPVLATVGTV